jgi:hypothetical protein
MSDWTFRVRSIESPATDAPHGSRFPVARVTLVATRTSSGIEMTFPMLVSLSHVPDDADLIVFARHYTHKALQELLEMTKNWSMPDEWIRSHSVEPVQTKKK